MKLKKSDYQELTDSDIDRVYKRVEETVNISKIKSKNDLFRKISSQPTTRNWNNIINQAIWERAVIKTSNKVEMFKMAAKVERKAIYIGKTPKRIFQVLYNKVTNSAQIVARDNKGRFVKFSSRTLRKVL